MPPGNIPKSKEQARKKLKYKGKPMTPKFPGTIDLRTGAPNGGGDLRTFQGPMTAPPGVTTTTPTLTAAEINRQNMMANRSGIAGGMDPQALAQRNLELRGITAPQAGTTVTGVPQAGASATSGYFANMPVTGTDWYGNIYNPSGRRSSAPEWLRWMSTISPIFESNGVTYVTPDADIRAIRRAKESGAKKGDSGMLELREKKKPRYRGG